MKTTIMFTPVARVALYYAGLLLSIALACNKKTRFQALILLSFLFASLNLSYTPSQESTERSISFFVALYDPFFNWFGVTKDFELLPGMTTCDNKNCSQLSGLFTHHPSWANVAYNRFVTSDEATLRRWRLIAHIWPNTIGMLLCLFQLHPTMPKMYPRIHRLVGRVVVILISLGTLFSLVLGLDSRLYPEYGGIYAVAGWFWMASILLGCLFAGVRSARRGDFIRHERWMKRFYGALFGAFFLFRLSHIAILGPLMRWHKSANFLLAIWTATPLGALAADLIHSQTVKKTKSH